MKTILVELDVTSVRAHHAVGFLEVWGNVGDDEIQIGLPLTDRRARSLLAGADERPDDDTGREAERVEN